MIEMSVSSIVSGLVVDSAAILAVPPYRLNFLVLKSSGKVQISLKVDKAWKWHHIMIYTYFDVVVSL